MLIFQLLRSALCEALAQVQASAARLCLQQAEQPQLTAAAAAGGAEVAAAGPAGAAGRGAGPGAAAAGEDGEGLFQRADRLVSASLVGVSAAFRQLEASVHATLDAQQGPAPPPAQDWQVLQGALTRVLGLSHLRRVFSRLQLQQAAGGRAGEAAPPVAPAAAGAAGQAPLAAGAAGAGAPASGAEALAEARRAVGYAAVLPANASVHSVLQAAQRSARAMRAKRIIQVRQRVLVGCASEAPANALNSPARRLGAHWRCQSAGQPAPQVFVLSLLQVPHWALMPSELQRHWIRYTLVGVAVGWGGVFLYK